MAEPLDETRILLALAEATRARLRDFALLPVVDSTNAEVLRRMAAGGGGGMVCAAERQTAGRGRRGRRWQSPGGGNVYLSVGWRFARAARGAEEGGGMGALSGLSLAVGVAVIDALEDCGVAGCSLKWPNDILFEGAKLGGILIEMAGGDAGRAVIGVGLNVAMPGAAGRSIEQAWTDIARVKPGGISRNLLLAALLDRLFALLEDYDRRGFAPWREGWRRRDAFLGREVSLISGSKRITGTCLGVSDSGALRLRVDGGEQVFHGGELSLRAAE